MKKKNRIALSRADRTFDTINYVILTIVLLLVAYPLYFIVIASVSDPVAVYAGKVRLWPEQFTLEGYRRILEYDAFSPDTATPSFTPSLAQRSMCWSPFQAPMRFRARIWQAATCS